MTASKNAPNPYRLATNEFEVIDDDIDMSSDFVKDRRSGQAREQEMLHVLFEICVDYVPKWGIGRSKILS